MSGPEEALSRRFGIILHDKGENGEEVLAAVVAAVVAEGVRVGGLYQRTATYPSGRTRMDLVEVRSGIGHEISQDLGTGSTACCLDAGALVGASALLRRDLDAGVDLLVVNKFAGLEVDGAGMAPDAFEALAGGIPVLTCLSYRYRDRFAAISGGLGTFLPPDADAVRAWVRGVLG